jgi:hypothetical protein
MGVKIERPGSDHAKLPAFGTPLNSRNPIRNLLGAVALLSLLFFATSLGEALHHHDSNSPDTHCQICHLSHQTLEKTAQGQGAANPELIGSLQTPPVSCFLVHPPARLQVTRAPPSA